MINNEEVDFVQVVVYRIVISLIIIISDHRFFIKHMNELMFRLKNKRSS